MAKTSGVTILEDTSNLQKRSWIKATICLLVGISLFLWLNPTFFTDLAVVDPPFGKIPPVQAWLSRVLYVSTFLMAMGAVLSLVFASRLWATLAMVFFALNLLVGSSFTHVKGRPMTLIDAQMLDETAGNKNDFHSAVSEFRATVAMVAVAVILLMALVIWGRRFARRRTSNTPLLACSLAVLLCYGARGMGREPVVVARPANFTPALAGAVIIAGSVLTHVTQKPEKELVLNGLPLDQAVKHVVLVIDESIESTVFAEVFQGAGLTHARDLGTAYSYANCSVFSNLMLRRGLNPLDLDRSFHRYPSLFQLAKKNGFTTAWLDAQGVLDGGGKSMQRLMDEQENSFIDINPPIEQFGRFYDRDFTAARILTDILKKDERAFVIVNKVGTHIPYVDNLPPDQAGVKNPYSVSVKRSSVGFLKQIDSQLPPGTLLFYTSDHGQNFSGKMTHCNLPGESIAGEWTVPMVVLYSEDLRRIAERIDPGWQDRASHAAMVETVRNLLGYKIPGMESLMTPPGPGSMQHRGFWGPPSPLFGQHAPFLVIDKSRRAFQN